MSVGTNATWFGCTEAECKRGITTLVNILDLYHVDDKELTTAKAYTRVSKHKYNSGYSVWL